VSADASQGICTPRGTSAGTPIPPQAAPVQCLLGPLASGAQARVTIVAHVTAAGTLIMRADVSSDQTDSNMQNNQATATTAVGQPPAPAADLQLSLAAPSQTDVGDSVRYVADVRNAGPGTAREVKLTTQLPGQAQLVGTSVPRGRCASTATAAGASSSSLT